MKGGHGAVLGLGVLSLAVGVVSRLMQQPIAGIEAHAIIEFASACFLLAIALSCCKGSCDTKS